MYITETTKSQINNEISNKMEGYNVLELLDLLDKMFECDCPVIELKGVRERYPSSINTIFNPASSMDDIIGSISDYFKVEALFKLILYYVEPEKYEQIISDVSGFSGILKALKLNPDNENLNREKGRIRDEHYLREIAEVYKLRNTEAHACRTWGRNQLFENINDVIISVIYCLGIHRRSISITLQKYNVESIKVSEAEAYMNELIEYFKQKMKKYIDLNGVENLEAIDRYVIENDNEETDNEEDDEKKRAGSINDIRNTNLPENKMMIWGEAGTGKSTTLEYLAYIDAQKWKKDNRSSIPVLIPLGILTSIDESIVDYMSKKLAISVEKAGLLLKNGKINMFIDGINEIAKDSSLNLKSKRLKEIKSLLENYPQSKFIITNRPNENVEFSGMPVFSLVKLTDEQVLLFLQKNTDSKNTISTILTAFEEKKRLKAIIRTPLMFSRLIDIVDVTGRVPTSEGAIIGAFLDSLFIREKNEKMDAQFDSRKANYLLRSIAYNGLEESSTNSGMTEETVLGYMKRCLDTYNFQVDTFYMLEIFQQLGILVKRDYLYVFAHQAYQDYYHAQEEMAILGIL